MGIKIERIGGSELIGVEVKLEKERIKTNRDGDQN